MDLDKWDHVVDCASCCASVRLEVASEVAGCRYRVGVVFECLDWGLADVGRAFLSFFSENDNGTILNRCVFRR